MSVNNSFNEMDLDQLAKATEKMAKNENDNAKIRGYVGGRRFQTDKDAKSVSLNTVIKNVARVLDNKTLSPDDLKKANHILVNIGNMNATGEDLLSEKNLIIRALTWVNSKISSLFYNRNSVLTRLYNTIKPTILEQTQGYLDANSDHSKLLKDKPDGTYCFQPVKTLFTYKLYIKGLPDQEIFLKYDPKKDEFSSTILIKDVPLKFSHKTLPGLLQEMKDSIAEKSLSKILQSMNFSPLEIEKAGGSTDIEKLRQDALARKLTGSEEISRAPGFVKSYDDVDWKNAPSGAFAIYESEDKQNFTLCIKHSEGKYKIVSIVYDRAKNVFASDGKEDKNVCVLAETIAKTIGIKDVIPLSLHNTPAYRPWLESQINLDALPNSSYCLLPKDANKFVLIIKDHKGNIAPTDVIIGKDSKVNLGSGGNAINDKEGNVIKFDSIQTSIDYFIEKTNSENAEVTPLTPLSNSIQTLAALKSDAISRARLALVKNNVEYWKQIENHPCFVHEENFKITIKNSAPGTYLIHLNEQFKYEIVNVSISDASSNKEGDTTKYEIKWDSIEKSLTFKDTPFKAETLFNAAAALNVEIMGSANVSLQIFPLSLGVDGYRAWDNKTQDQALPHLLPGDVVLLPTNETNKFMVHTVKHDNVVENVYLIANDAGEIEIQDVPDLSEKYKSFQDAFNAVIRRTNLQSEDSIYHPLDDSIKTVKDVESNILKIKYREIPDEVKDAFEESLELISTEELNNIWKSARIGSYGIHYGLIDGMPGYGLRIKTSANEDIELRLNYIEGKSIDQLISESLKADPRLIDLPIHSIGKEKLKIAQQQAKEKFRDAPGFYDGENFTTLWQNAKPGEFILQQEPNSINYFLKVKGKNPVDDLTYEFVYDQSDNNYYFITTEDNKKVEYSDANIRRLMKDHGILGKYVPMTNALSYKATIDSLRQDGDYDLLPAYRPSKKEYEDNEKFRKENGLYMTVGDVSYITRTCVSNMHANQVTGRPSRPQTEQTANKIIAFQGAIGEDFKVNNENFKKAVKKSDKGNSSISTHFNVMTPETAFDKNNKTKFRDETWNMIWDQNLSGIANLTNTDTVDDKGNIINNDKRSQFNGMEILKWTSDYFPTTPGEIFTISGGLTVKCMPVTDITVKEANGDAPVTRKTLLRKFILTKETEKGIETREIAMVHVEHWEDMSGKDPSELVQLAKDIRTYCPKDANGKYNLGVHCRAGMGRTATLITVLEGMDEIDAQIKEIQTGTRENITVNKDYVAHLIYNLRKDRGNSMIQKEHQLYSARKAIALYLNEELIANGLLEFEFPKNIIGMTKILPENWDNYPIGAYAIKDKDLYVKVDTNETRKYELTYNGKTKQYEGRTEGNKDPYTGKDLNEILVKIQIELSGEDDKVRPLSYPGIKEYICGDDKKLQGIFTTSPKTKFLIQWGDHKRLNLWVRTLNGINMESISITSDGFKFLDKVRNKEIEFKNYTDLRKYIEQNVAVQDAAINFLDALANKQKPKDAGESITNDIKGDVVAPSSEEPIEAPMNNEVKIESPDKGPLIPKESRGFSEVEVDLKPFPLGTYAIHNDIFSIVESTSPRTLSIRNFTISSEDDQLMATASDGDTVTGSDLNDLIENIKVSLQLNALHPFNEIDLTKASSVTPSETPAQVFERIKNMPGGWADRTEDEISSGNIVWGNAPVGSYAILSRKPGEYFFYVKDVEGTAKPEKPLTSWEEVFKAIQGRSPASIPGVSCYKPFDRVQAEASLAGASYDKLGEQILLRPGGQPKFMVVSSTNIERKHITIGLSKEGKFVTENINVEGGFDFYDSIPKLIETFKKDALKNRNIILKTIDEASLPCYRQCADRIEANKLLESESYPNGTFLIRSSTRSPFVISVKAAGENIHMPISLLADGRFTVTKTDENKNEIVQYFNSLNEIESYVTEDSKNRNPKWIPINLAVQI